MTKCFGCFLQGNAAGLGYEGILFIITPITPTGKPKKNVLMNADITSPKVRISVTGRTKKNF
jgi:hypothetical protein